MTFAQALARIEELSRGAHSEYDELGDLLIQHADSIVQLGKVAAEMREALQDDIDNPETDTVDYMSCRAYDKLMKEE